MEIETMELEDGNVEIQYTYDTFVHEGSREYYGGPPLEPDDEEWSNFQLHKVTVMDMDITDDLDCSTTYEAEEDLWVQVRDYIHSCIRCRRQHENR